MVSERLNSADNSGESQEADHATIARWFAGALEVGGTISFGIQRRKNGHISAYPYIAFCEKNEDYISLLKKEFGGAKVKRGDSWEWRISGYKAAELVVDTESYTAVSRGEVVAAMRLWLESTTAERVAIAEAMKGFDRYQDIKSEGYTNLVTDPIFVAGVIDNRGTIYPHSDGLYTYPGIEVNSKNKALLDALQTKYRGKVDIKVEAGTKIVIDKEEFETIRDSYVWITSNLSARELLSSASPYLRIAPYKEWNERKVEVVKEERANRDTAMIALISDELARFARHEIDRPSTVEELAEKFATSVRTVNRRLSGLPAELRKQRKCILNSTRVI